MPTFHPIRLELSKCYVCEMYRGHSFWSVKSASRRPWCIDGQNKTYTLPSTQSVYKNSSFCKLRRICHLPVNGKHSGQIYLLYVAIQKLLNKSWQNSMWTFNHWTTCIVVSTPSMITRPRKKNCMCRNLCKLTPATKVITLITANMQVTEANIWS
jgi:hypothetical protein